MKDKTGHSIFGAIEQSVRSIMAKAFRNLPENMADKKILSFSEIGEACGPFNPPKADPNTGGHHRRNDSVMIVDAQAHRAWPHKSLRKFAQSIGFFLFKPISHVRPDPLSMQCAFGCFRLQCDRLIMSEKGPLMVVGTRSGRLGSEFCFASAPVLFRAHEAIPGLTCRPRPSTFK